jgi:hypothetical protein
MEPTAGVEHNLPLQILAADPSEFVGYFLNRAVRRGDEDASRGQNAPRQADESSARADETNGTPRARLISRDDRTDPPAQFAHSAS